MIRLLGYQSVSGVNNFTGKGQGKIHHVVSNVLDDKKEAVVMMIFLEKKSLTKDVDKGTDELEDMKEAVVTICRKYSDKFEGKSKGSTRWFYLDSEFKKKSTIEQDLYKNLYEKDIEGQEMEPYKTFLCLLIKNISRQKCNQCTKFDYLIRSTSTRSNNGEQNSNWYIC